MKTLRLFWAVNLPADIKARFTILQEQLKTAQADIKWVEERNLHLTIKFLGDVENVKIPDIIERVKKEVAGIGDIHIRFQGMGTFLQRGLPRVIWVGGYDENGKLKTLHDKVQKSMIPLDFVPERKKFSPHLTLGRARSSHGAQVLLREINKFSSRNVIIGSVNIKTIYLMQSRLTRQGPVYSALECIKVN